MTYASINTKTHILGESPTNCSVEKHSPVRRVDVVSRAVLLTWCPREEGMAPLPGAWG